MKSLKLFNITWNVDTAGPSPFCNERTEIFLFGCQKAMNGNPCKGCFNTALWDSSKVQFEHEVDEIVENIVKFAPNKYITIGGGEPIDQIDSLIELTEKLKAKGFHIMLYTWHSLYKELMKKPVSVFGIVDPHAFTRGLGHKIQKLIKNIDIIVDGEFKQEECLYDENKGDGFLNSVGSGNQIIWDCHEFNQSDGSVLKGYAMRELNGIALRENNELIYFLKDLSSNEEIIYF